MKGWETAERICTSFLRCSTCRRRTISVLRSIFRAMCFPVGLWRTTRTRPNVPVPTVVFNCRSAKENASRSLAGCLVGVALPACASPARAGLRAAPVAAARTRLARAATDPAASLAPPRPPRLLADTATGDLVEAGTPDPALELAVPRGKLERAVLVGAAAPGPLRADDGAPLPTRKDAERKPDAVGEALGGAPAPDAAAARAPDEATARRPCLAKWLMPRLPVEGRADWPNMSAALRSGREARFASGRDGQPAGGGTRPFAELGSAGGVRLCLCRLIGDSRRSCQ